MTAYALGKPYDDSSDQPPPGLPAPTVNANANVGISDSMQARMAIIDAADAIDATNDGGAWGELPDPGPSIELPGPSNFMLAGRAILEQARKEGRPPYRYWQGEFYVHTGTHYTPVDKAAINKWLYHITENAWYTRTVKGIPEVFGWNPDRKKIGNLAHALSDGLLTYTGDEIKCIALQDGVYNLKTDKVDPHSSTRFNLTVLPFAHEENATCPRWLEFLNQVLPGDTQAHEFLGEWFGYVLSGRTDIHKMVSLVGKPRCGKGTINRVLGAMLGTSAVTAPTLRQLGGSFGEEPLIGKKLATLSDVRWTAAAASDAIEVLLAISGDDHRTVPRKNRQAWEGHLGVRFMIMGNDIPNFRDVSGALVGRMMQIHFEQSFEGRENRHLTDELLTELPGIFNWAIEGLHRLNRRGRFAPPESGEELTAEVRRLASPYQAFIEDFCELEADAETAVPELLRGYKQWCRRENRTLDAESQTTSSLSRGLRTTSACVTVSPHRPWLASGQRVTVLRGIKLATPPEWLGQDRADEHRALTDTYQQPELDGIDERAGPD